MMTLTQTLVNYVQVSPTQTSTRPLPQVFDLAEGGPMKGLTAMRNVPGLRVIAAGGDGTLGWVMSAMDKVPYPKSYS